MRVGIVTTSYPQRPGDPAGHFVASHAHALRRLGHHVEVIAAGDATASTPDLQLLDGRGLFDRGGAPDLLERTPTALVAAARFTACMTVAVHRRARDWDGIIAHWLAPSALAALPTRLPLLAIAHGGDLHTLRRLHLLGPALHALHRRGAELAFVAAELRDLARAAAPRLQAWLATARIQPMGLDLARFAAIQRTPAAPPVLAIAARAVPLKGIDIALDALARVTAPAHLVIAGDGPARAALERRARSFGGRVTFLGTIPTPARDQLLARASLVLVPSRIEPNGRTEGTPLIALEALAAGIPVIASAVGGLRDLAPAITLVPPADPAALAAAITRALATPPPPAATLQAYVSHLDWSRVATRLLPAK